MKNRYQLAVCAAALILLGLLSGGCAPAAEPFDPSKGGNVSGAYLDESSAGSNEIFDLAGQTAGAEIGIDFRGALTQGAVHVQITDDRGQAIWQAAASQGTFAINEVVTLPAAGNYKLGLAWDGPVKLTDYGLYWSKGKVAVPAVSPVALLSGAGMAAVTIGLIVYARRRKLGWKFILFGALAWVVSVALKFAWAIPINPLLYQALQDNLPGWLAGGVFYVYVGSLTGWFEVGLVWLVMRYSPLGKNVTWEKALAFGIGFGAVEALALSISPLAAVIAAMAAPSSMSLGTLQSIAALNDPITALTPVWERFFTVWVHIFSNVLIFYALGKHQARWFWLAFVFKTGIDSFAAWGQVAGLDVPGRMALLEGIVALWGLLGWYGTHRVEKTYPLLEAAEAQPGE
jgi:uncharacterized membrane protein YhfC